MANKITYTYQIVAVNEVTMDVEYTNPDYGTVLVGVRIPYDGESLEDVIAHYSPASWWAERIRPKLEVAVGVSGTGEVQIIPEPIVYTEAQLKQMWRETATISKLQAHYTLKVWGLYDQVLALVTAVGDPLELAFHNALEWRRNSPSIISLFTHLEMTNGEPPTEEDVDQFFVEAQGFVV
jgi:hypothetical protein